MRRGRKRPRKKTRLGKGKRRWNGVFREMAIKQEWTCPLCGGHLHDGRPVDIDHIRPISLGGDNSALNKQLTHSTCNVAKGNKWDGVSGWPPQET